MESVTRTSSALLLDDESSFCQLLADRLIAEHVVDTVEFATQPVTGNPIGRISLSTSLIISDREVAGTNCWTFAESLLPRLRGCYIVLSSHLTAAHVDRLWKTGVGGCLSKLDTLAENLRSISAVLAGQRVLSPRLRRQVLADPARAAALPNELLSSLSSRQLDVLVLLSMGYSVKEAARKLESTVKSIDSIKFRLMKHLDLHDRVALTRFAIREGLIDA